MQQKLAGKRGWGDDAKHNLMSVVKALLLVADEKLELDDPEFNTALQVEWCSEKKLRVTGEIKKKTARSEKTIEVGTTKKDLAHLVEKAGESLELPKQKQESNSSGEEREASAVQNVIDCLKVLGLLEDERPNNRKNTRYWKFTLTLKSQFSTEENLRWCEQKWNEHTQKNSPFQTTSKSATEDDINWREICSKVLAQQRENQRLRRQATEWGFELNVYVPLGLVERKQQQRRRGDVALEEVYQLTEEVITKEYDNDKFLTEVIEPGKSKRIAIIGEPGAGKTTLQEKIAVWLHEKNKGLPICIPLGGLQGKSLEEYLQQIWLKVALQFIEPDASAVEARHIVSLKQQFREGKVWLLLDGVDEMAATSPVEALATIKEQLTNWLLEAQVLLTCRFNVWDANVTNLLTDFETYRTLEFKPDQVEKFIRDWFAEAGKADPPLAKGGLGGDLWGEKLLSKLHETGKERIWKLVTNPLRLSLLCQISYLLPVDEPLPDTKAALYQRFTSYFYEWKQEQRPTTRTERRQLNQALGELAKSGINSKARFRLGENLACDVMGESLFDLACRLGWLNLVDRDSQTDEAVYAFFHPTFQEYFAACAIEDWGYFLPRSHDNNNPKPVSERYRIFEPQWKEVILLWLGRKKDEDFEKHKDVFVETLIKFKDGCGDFYKYRAYFLAAMGIAEFKDSSFADEIMSQMVEWLIKVPRYGCFGEEIRAAIKETDTRRVIKKFISLLNNSIYKNKRHEIIECLADIGVSDSQAIGALNKIIDGQHENKCCIEIAAYCLGKIGNGNFKKKAIATLINILNTQRYNKSTVTYYLGEIGCEDQDVIEALAKQLRLTNPNNPISQIDLWYIAFTLVKITPSSNVIYQEASNILKKNENPIDHLQAEEETLTIAALHELGLNEINAENLQEEIISIIKKINYLVRNNFDKNLQNKVSWCLKNIVFGKHFLPQKDLMNLVIIGFKDCTKEQIRENSQVIWHCAQNLPYPDFYQAWHPTTIEQRG